MSHVELTAKGGGLKMQDWKQMDRNTQRDGKSMKREQKTLIRHCIHFISDCELNMSGSNFQWASQWVWGRGIQERAQVDILRG